MGSEPARARMIRFALAAALAAPLAIAAQQAAAQQGAGGAKAPAKPAAKSAAPAPQAARAASAGDVTSSIQPDAGAAQQGPKVVRSEVSAHDFWTVACDHFDAPTPPRCMARMPVFRSSELKQVLVVVSISKGVNDQWLLNLHVPTSIAIQPGAEIRFGDKTARKIAIQTCEPALCTASVALDPALRAELTAAQNATASWTSLIGGEIKTDFPLKGAAPALAALIK